MNIGAKVKTWISDKIGTVVDYNPVTKIVTVKYKGSSGYDELPLSMCELV